MKRLIFWLCAFVPWWVVAQDRPSPQPVGAPSAMAASAAGIVHHTLPNGMQLIVKVDRRAPTAVHMVWVRVGSIDEVDGKSGIAHVLEHMLFKGTETLAPGEFSRRVAALGGSENAFTSKDYTGYFQMIPAQRLPDVMRLEADRFYRNRWSDEDFAKEIEVIKEERRLRTDDVPRSALYEQLSAVQFSASPYRRPIIGWMNDLEHLRPADVREFYRQWYVPANATVAVVGDVDPARVLQWAQEFYGVIPAGVILERKPREEPEQKGIRRLQFKAPAEQSYLVMSWKVPGLRGLNADANTTDALALTMLSALLDGYSGSRLDRRLTQGADRVADSAGSYHSLSGRGPNVFVLDGVPAPGKTATQLEQALRAEIERVARDGVTEAELRRVRAQWTAAQVYGRDSLFNQAREIGTWWVTGLPLDTSDRLIEMLQNVTGAQVQDVARRYFQDDQLTVAELLPQPMNANPPRRPAVPIRH
ncbi:MAG: pitrilysin family protein [Alphaproteobacteria bacterium]|nr:pitrilysin family protein [Alphaproteobacteria bacterium]